MASEPTNPLELSDWDSLVSAHPESLFFHTSAWARVLHETYGHRPVCFCRFCEGKLESLLPLMEVASSFTGKRAVSLPFTDFCPSLQTAGKGIEELYEDALEYGRQRGWRFLECRGHGKLWPRATPSLGFFGHIIDLKPGEEAIFKRFESAMRRGIRKAESAKLHVEFGGGTEFVRAYYQLHCLTRRKHGLPPQPKRFFTSIGRHALERGRGFIALMRQDQREIAAMLFLHHGKRAFYKFGASDPAFQQLRPNNLLMWEAIKHCATLGFENLHLGRTSLTHDGLRRYKLAFGAREESIEYSKYEFGKRAFVTDIDRVEGWFNPVFRVLPAPLLRLAGEILYPHLS